MKHTGSEDASSRDGPARMTDRTFTLSAISRADGPLLSNLLELYIHDVSALFVDVQLGSDGRFGYPNLAAYLSGSSERLGFLIRSEQLVAGFALVTRGSPVAKDASLFDVAEYFVLRRFRRRGVGRAAAGLLWDRLPGAWTVRVADVNPAAVAFWRRVVTSYTNNSATESERRDGSKNWVVFSFDNTV